MSLPRISSAQSEGPTEARRFALTERFMAESLPPPASLLDIGPPNTLGRRLERGGYEVAYTGEVDLDEHPAVVDVSADAATAFEVLEHLVNPLGVLRAVAAPRLFTTVPMRLWFSKAYWNEDDPWDRHYHEFEPRQFDWLLEKAGWEVVRREEWTNPSPGLPLGIRPLLRLVTPRWYVVEAKRSS